MAENTNIEWATHTWNPWRGCTKVSAGCANCYADTMSKRNPLTLGVWGPNGTRVVAAESAWKLPLKWNKAAALAEDLWRSIGGDTSKPGTIDFEGTPATWHRPRVFPSLCDPFEDWQGPMVDSRGHVVKVNRNGPTSDWVWYADTLRVGQNVATMSDVRRRLFGLIDATPNLDWLLLTKRPENIARMMPPRPVLIDGEECNKCVNECRCTRPNLWLGTSVENQPTADERIPHLLSVPAAVRFLSVEPLLGPVDLTRVMQDECRIDARDGSIYKDDLLSSDPTSPSAWPVSYTRQLNWAIVGGESGPGARPCRVEWIRELVRQCREAGVPCFVKQDFGPKPGMRGRLDDELWNTKEIPDAR